MNNKEISKVLEILSTLSEDVEVSERLRKESDYVLTLSQIGDDNNLSLRKKNAELSLKYTGPGPQELIGYYETPGNPARHHGFFGEVPSSEFIDGQTLASAVGLSNAGKAHNNDTPWLKFLIDGKIVFIPKLTLRHSITWQQIYQAGCVYADDTTGEYHFWNPVLQNKRVMIQGHKFKVGLLSGTNEDPCSDTFGYDIITTHGCEWNRLFYNITRPNPNYPKTSQEGDQWWDYTEADLGIATADNGRYSWCKESNTDISNYRVVRGGYVTFLGTGVVTYVSAGYGWRPRLELITS